VPRVSKTLVFRLTTVAVALAICLVAYVATRSQPAGAAPWYGIVPPLLAVTLALVTNRLFLSLVAAVLAGGVLSLVGHFEGSLLDPIRGLAQGGRFVVETLYSLDGFEISAERVNTSNVEILLFVILIMPTISVMLVGGGLQGVANWLLRFARGVRSTKLATIFSGMVIFIDDYANTMIVGPTLRPVTDRQRISREKLAFLVDATAAPIAGIALVSTWIGVEVSLLSGIAQTLDIEKGGYEIFLDALGFRFYCFGMIAFVILNAYSGQDFGPMAAAERRARIEGKVLADDAVVMSSRSMTSAQPHRQARISAPVAVVPLIVLLGVFLARWWFDAGGGYRLASDPWSIFRLSEWREVCGSVDSIPLLVFASTCSLLVAIGLALCAARVPLAALVRAVVMGLRGSLLPVTVLILAWSLKRTCEELDTGVFLANMLGEWLPPAVFPGLVFIVAALTSFATGTSFGTMAILIPTAIPLAFRLDGDTYGLVTVISIGAVLDGAIFGDHCSPISDTTIMSSTASSCDHLAHVRTQIPYSLVVAGLALCVGYLPAAALGVPSVVGHLAGAILSGLLFLALWLYRSRRRARLERA
jgi:Na+/H+ antiporter NhaC